MGILWFGVRREWLNFSLAIAATLAIIAATALVTPGLWADWFALLMSSTSSSTVPGSVPIPLMARLPVAIAVIVLAAWKGWRWLLPIGVLLAMPVIWWGSLALLTACVALKRDEIEDRIESPAGGHRGPLPCAPLRAARRRPHPTRDHLVERARTTRGPRPLKRPGGPDVPFPLACAGLPMTSAGFAGASASLGAPAAAADSPEAAATGSSRRPSRAVTSRPSDGSSARRNAKASARFDLEGEMGLDGLRALADAIT